MHGDVATFLGIVFVLTVTPGADMALVMRHVLAHGMAATWPTLAGILTGVTVHVTLCVSGMSIILRRSDVAFTTVKLAGACWLAWLGISALLDAIRHRHDARAVGDAVEPAAPVARGPMPSRNLYTRGLLTNLLNVKIALFYIAFLPQFAPSGDAFVPVALLLAASQAAIGMAWLASYALLVFRAGSAFGTSPRLRRLLEGSTGAALIGFGARLAAAAR